MPENQVGLVRRALRLLRRLWMWLPRWVRIVTVNVVLTIIGIRILFVLIPMSGNFTVIRRDAIQFDETKIPRFRPNMRAEPYLHGGDYTAITLTTNAEGFRDIDHAVAKPPGVIRVALVGDSYVFAPNLPEHQTTTAYLQKTLNELNDGRKYEVFNFGIPGLQLQGMASVVQSFAVKYQPDFVFYSHIADDVSQIDIIDSWAWRAKYEPMYRDAPQWLREDLNSSFDLIKEWRYRGDYTVLTTIWPLYRKRLMILLDLLEDIANTSHHQAALLDYCRQPLVRESVRTHNETRHSKVDIITDFLMSKDPTDHPSNESNAALAVVLAKYIQERAPTAPAPTEGASAQ